MKAKTHLDKLEKIQSKMKHKFITWENGPWEIWWTPSVFKFKYDFNAFCYSKLPDFENVHTLLTMNKGSGVFGTSSSSQASQDESVVCDFVKSEGERIR